MGPEFIIVNASETYTLATDLTRNSNYTFFVRLYNKNTSDHSEHVTCQPGKNSIAFYVASSTMNIIKSTLLH